MSDLNDDSQVTPTEPAAAPAQEPTQELSLAEELSQANDKTTDSDEEIPETPVEPPKPEETEEPKPAEPEEQPKEKVDEEPVETEAERKQRFYEMRQQQKQAKQQAEQALQQQYQPQPVDDLVQKYIDEGYNQFEAEWKAETERSKQEREIEKAINNVSRLNMQFGTEAVQVMHDFPVFDPNSPEYDKELATKASKLFESHAGVQRNEQGYIVSAAATPYPFYKEIAEMRGATATKAQVQAQKAAEQQMASVAPPSSTAPVVNKSSEDAQADRLAAAFDKTA